MKVALITDTHFGARGDSAQFNEYFFRFWENVFFPYIEKHKIEYVVHLGDAVDRRKFINFATLNSLRTRFFDRLGKSVPNLKMYVLVGNHDVPYRNSNEVNAIEELFGSNKHVHVLSEAQDIVIDGLPIAMIPWINSSNYESTKEFIQNSAASIAMGHLEITGFEMDKGHVCTEGMEREVFSKFETVYTGHFHHRSTDGHIFYLGNPYEITWADYDDTRGFHIFDTATRDVEFIENPYKMFHKIMYNDLRNDTFDAAYETLESVQNKDFSMFNNTVVKVVVVCKDNPILFEMFMEKLQAAHPLDITIVEDFTDYSEISESDVVDQADPTTTILDKYIDSIELNLDKSKMKNVLRDVYHEALNQETT